MSIENDILKLLKSEGYSINEAVKDAVGELIEICEEEAEVNIDEDEDIDEDEED